MHSLQKDITKFPNHYFILLCLQLVGLVGVYWFNYDAYIQFTFILYMSISYVLWGAIHHKIAKDFHIKILLEYTLFAIVASLLLGVLILKP